MSRTVLRIVKIAWLLFVGVAIGGLLGGLLASWQAGLLFGGIASVVAAFLMYGHLELGASDSWRTEGSTYLDDEIFLNRGMELGLGLGLEKDD